MGGPGRGLCDKHGRSIEYMRVSLTEKCNFRCNFCVPEDGEGTATAGDDGLDAEETLRLCALFHRLGVDNFKITGGEPFMNPHALAIMRRLKRTVGAGTVTVTTNGSTLDRHAAELAAIGVDGINVSLNAMCQETFSVVTGSAMPLGRILENVELAAAAGLRVKLNMVPIRGVNTGEILPLLEFALERGLYLRFIELMPIGQGRALEGLSLGDILQIIEKRFGRAEIAAGRFGNGPAVYLAVKGYDAKIGYIAAVSEKFCATCNRIRLTHAGYLRTCLHHNHGADLAAPMRCGETDAQLAERIRSAVADKPEHHLFETKSDAPDLGGDPMFQIGG